MQILIYKATFISLLHLKHGVANLDDSLLSGFDPIFCGTKFIKEK